MADIDPPARRADIDLAASFEASGVGPVQFQQIYKTITYCAIYFSAKRRS